MLDGGAMMFVAASNCGRHCSAAVMGVRGRAAPPELSSSRPVHEQVQILTSCRPPPRVARELPSLWLRPQSCPIKRWTVASGVIRAS